MTKQLVRNIRAAAITAAFESGNANPQFIRRALRDAADGVSIMSIAGIKAAIVKGQNVALISKGECNSKIAYK